MSEDAYDRKAAEMWIDRAKTIITSGLWKAAKAGLSENEIGSMVISMNRRQVVVTLTPLPGRGEAVTATIEYGEPRVAEPRYAYRDEPEKKE